MRWSPWASTLVYGTMRLLNIAHGELVMLGGYITYWSFTSLGNKPIAVHGGRADPWSGVSARSFTSSLFRRLLRSPKLAARVEANSLLIFFGVSVIFQNVMALLFTSTQRGYVYLDQVIQIGSVAMTANRLILFGVGDIGLFVVSGVLQIHPAPAARFGR